MRLRAVVHEGDLIPWFFGISYWRCDIHAAICHVWPLNHVVGMSRRIWFKIRDHPMGWKDYAHSLEDRLHKQTTTYLQDMIQKRIS